MIKRVTIENWKSHLRTQLDFAKGTNVLVGISGSGKSSVMDAICFSLFGSFPTASSRTLKLEEVIMSKPLEKTHSRTITEFSYNNKNYVVERTINKKGLNEGKLFEESRLIAGPKPSEVNKRIEEIIEVNYELFSRAVYSEQNQVDFFLKLNDAQRKEKLDELLMLKKYEQVRSSAVSLQNRLKKEAEMKKNWLKEQEKKNLEQELLELKKKEFEKEQRKTGLADEKKQLEKKLVEAQESLKGLELDYQKFSLLKEEEIKARTRIDSKKAQLEKLEKELFGKTDIENEAKKLLEEKKKNALETEHARGLLESLSGKLAHLSHEATQNTELVSKAQKYLGELVEAGATCPVCKRSLQEEMKSQIKAQTLEEKKSMQEKISLMEKQQKETMEEITKTKKLVREKEALSLEIAGKEAGLKSLAAKNEEKEQLQQELKELLEKKLAAEKSLKELSFDEKALLGKKGEALKAEEKISFAKKEERAIDEFLGEIKNSIERTQKNLEETAVLRKETVALLGAGEKTGVFISALKATQAELRGSLIATINEAVSDIWQHIYPYEDLVDCRIDVTEEGNYEIIVQEKNGAWKKVEGILSGGERSCVALTIRIAISLVLAQNLGWLILDEPTHNLDKNTVKKLSGFLKTHLPELIDQIFIITHEKEMENAASASLYFLEREKGEEQPSKATMQEIMD